MITTADVAAFSTRTKVQTKDTPSGPGLRLACFPDLHPKLRRAQPVLGRYIPRPSHASASSRSLSAHESALRRITSLRSRSLCRFWSYIRQRSETARRTWYPSRRTPFREPPVIVAAQELSSGVLMQLDPLIDKVMGSPCLTLRATSAFEKGRAPGHDADERDGRLRFSDRAHVRRVLPAHLAREQLWNSIRSSRRSRALWSPDCRSRQGRRSL
ncbi:hypothetical protein EXIGLDRAFT_524300 [Exidia glandulosa HHB12029]|uniref:Uncharacterized protein n=1 Tax=Exidia glandulosa HHB12029 TaxID=1314781 RepID=A0A165J1E5_EXIGL|nr:hypothetical protein EXIGLDRAFT_524300 [Exidia glandulosa HHB12029]